MNSISELKAIALNIVNEYYPSVECAILTGSQLEPDFVAPSSDIDIVLISNDFSGLTSHVIRTGKNKVDFTRLSLSQIQTILVDNAYDHQGIVLTMINKGIVLKDKYNIFSQIGSLAKTLNEHGSLSANLRIKELRREMIKLKKHLKKDLKYPYNLFMLADFAKLISSFHLFAINKGQYDNDAFRIIKSINCKEGNLNFPITIAEVVKKAINDINQTKPLLMYYIDKYLDMVFPIDNKKDETFIINIQTQFPSNTIFYNKAINVIFSNQLLSNFFCYCQTNSYSHIFQNKFVLFFNTSSDKDKQQEIIEELRNEFRKEHINITQLNTIQADYLEYIFPDQQTYRSVESILNKVSQLIIQTGKTKKYNVQKAIILCLILALMLAQQFKLNKNDIEIICKYLITRWRPSKIISNIENEQGIHEKNNIFMQYTTHYYELNKEIFNRIYCATSTSDNDFIDNINLSVFKDLFSSFKRKINEKNVPINKVYKHIFKTNDPQKLCYYYYYISLLDMISATLGVNYEDRSKVAFTMSQIYH